MSLIRAIGPTLQPCGVRQGEPIGHPREVVDHPVLQRPVARRQTVRIVDERVEDRLDRGTRLPVLGLDVRAEVDPVEHERAQREHRLTDLGALDDVPGQGRLLDDVVHEPVDPLRAARAEQRDLVARQVGRREQPVADRVVDVVVDVRDPVDEADDPPLQRLRLLDAGVGEDAVTDLVTEVQPLARSGATARCAGTGGRTAC